MNITEFNTYMWFNYVPFEKASTSLIVPASKMIFGPGVMARTYPTA